MWNAGLANEIAQQMIGDKLHKANDRAVLKQAGRADAMPHGALRNWFGHLLIGAGQRLQGPLAEQRASFTSAG
jgi:hypothetical protein